MQPEFRKLYNVAFSDDVYAAYCRELERRTETTYEFRLAETPVFLPEDLRQKIATAAREIIAKISDPALIEQMKVAVPAKWDTPGIGKLPSFAQVDFAIVRDADGSLSPKLIELQGFPSLTALEVMQRDSWQKVLDTIPGLAGIEWTCWFDHEREAFLDLARRTICGSHDPREVVMMDIEPASQKTYPDFASTRILFGVDSIDPRELLVRGNRLFRRDKDGRELRVRRIYNRVVFDELEVRKLALPFDYRDELDVEWTPHPNWYWIWSKYSLPFIQHPAVPRATFVSELSSIPDDLTERYVLKPLFSFAGGGVNVEPTAADIERIPTDQRPFWCVQEKIAYEPALIAADGGGVKVEVRTMFLRPDDEPELVLAQNLCRLSRGKMLGVDFNKDFTWVGGTVGIWPVTTLNAQRSALNRKT
jgi:hypothetical protein